MFYLKLAMLNMGQVISETLNDQETVEKNTICFRAYKKWWPCRTINNSDFICFIDCGFIHLF